MPDAKTLLRKWFSENEMSCLWGRLKRFMGTKAQASTREEWAAIEQKGHREGKQEAKNQALLLSVAMPDNWEQQWVSESTRIDNERSKASTRTRYYRGELEQLHGIQEAADFIAKGKYLETEDSDGDIVYTKKQYSETDKKSHTTSSETRNQGRTTKEKQDALYASMAK